MEELIISSMKAFFVIVISFVLAYLTRGYIAIGGEIFVYIGAIVYEYFAIKNYILGAERAKRQKAYYKKSLSFLRANIAELRQRSNEQAIEHECLCKEREASRKKLNNEISECNANIRILRQKVARLASENKRLKREEGLLCEVIYDLSFGHLKGMQTDEESSERIRNAKLIEKEQKDEGI